LRLIIFEEAYTELKQHLEKIQHKDNMLEEAIKNSQDKYQLVLQTTLMIQIKHIVIYQID
jgi:exonuclease VII small subunit